MCFSATASFGAGAVLTTAGVVSLRHASEARQILFAGIPLVFAFQQAVEGCVWLALTHRLPAGLAQPATYTFLFLAQVVWPFYIPLAMMVLERQRWRRNILTGISCLGILAAMSRAWSLLSHDVFARTLDHHISYRYDHATAYGEYGLALYLLLLVVPTFLSGIRWMWTFGVAILLSYVLAEIVFAEFAISVWCFFAAIISVCVFAIVRTMHPVSGNPPIRETPVAPLDGNRSGIAPVGRKILNVPSNGP